MIEPGGPLAGARPAAEAEPEPAPSRRGSRLRGKIALVTGGGTGIGRAVSELFAREGASVVLAGRRSEPLQETVQQIRRDGGVATFARGDVSRADRAEMLVQGAVYNFGGLDILVNSASMWAPGSILDTDERKWDRILNTNLKGPYIISRLSLPAMRSRGGGSIVNIASVSGLAGAAGAAAYSASMGGLIALTKSMALDFAADRIRVNAVCPALLDTPATRGALKDGAAFTDEAARAYPLGRLGTAEDVARLALYLASDESGWVTGSVFPIDGGLLTR